MYWWNTLLPAGRLAAYLLLLMWLAGCKGGPSNPITDKRPLGGSKEAPREAPAVPTAPRTAKDWETELGRLKDERDSLAAAVTSKDHEIEAAEQRLKDEKAAEVIQAREREANIGRWIAGLCAAASVALTIASFIPGWGSLIPKWAGPLGMLASVIILIAAQVWVWVALHIVSLSIGAAVIGIGVLIYTFRTGAQHSLLLTIRQRFHDLMEAATSEADKLDIKADTLEAEITHGVHKLGQTLRKKPVKTMADVHKLRIAAAAERATS